MRTHRLLRAGSIFFVAGLLFDSQPANANAIAFSDLTAFSLRIADKGSGITAIDPLFTTLALAHAQNSLGDLDDVADLEIGTSAAASATVTWANAASSSSDSRWSANSSAHVPGAIDGAANSAGQALWFASFMIDCPTCVGSTTVDFSVDLSGNLEVQTDLFGQLAQTETAFNLLVNGDTLLFRHDLLSIGPNDHKVLSISTTLASSLTLTYGTPYDLVLRTDSESSVINKPVPEPATVTLLGLGISALAVRRRRRSREEDTR